MPSSIRIQPVAFDPRTYSIEDPITFKNDAGLLKERDCAVDCIIRYRYVEGEEDQAVTSDERLDIVSQKGKKVDSIFFLNFDSLRLMLR